MRSPTGGLVRSTRGWIGVDLDGTLAVYSGWQGEDKIGAPVPKMVDRVVGWITDPDGPSVRIMTARVSPLNPNREASRKHIQEWLYKHVYPKCPLWFREPFQIELEITHEKDYQMIELWDDRAVQVIPNTGERADGKT